MAYIGYRPVSGDNNSFRVLDDIKTHTFTFDGSSSSVINTTSNDKPRTINVWRRDMYVDIVFNSKFYLSFFLQ